MAGMPNPDSESRFWSRVDKAAGEASCWPWTGKTNPGGYGVAGRDKAHREAFKRANGWLPAGNRRGDLVIRHTCDNPLCCNPGHLSVGTHKQNTADAVARGRIRTPAARQGCDHPRARFDAEQVSAILEALECGESAASIARRVGCGASTVRRIARGESYSGWRLEKTGGHVMAWAIARLTRKAGVV